MSKHDDVLVPKRTWTLLTNPADGAITGVRLQNLGSIPVRVQAKADSDPAGLSVGGALIMRDPTDIFYESDLLVDLFPGVTTPLHLFAWCPTGTTEISVSYA